MERFTAAAVQMNAGEDKAANLAKATRLVEDAASRGAHVIALPEMWNCLGRLSRVVELAEEVPGPTSEAMGALAKRLGVTLIAGSIAERTPSGRMAYNTALVFGPDGEVLTRYRKVHLFDVNIPGQVVYEESRHVAAGSDVVSFSVPAARFGLAICYDLRFPELFRSLADRGMEVLALVSAFSSVTGRDHFEPLLRARAIENQCFVLAPNQAGRHPPEAPVFSTHGHSMILDPWGNVLAALADGEGVITAELDPARLAAVRARLPALSHRRIR